LGSIAIGDSTKNNVVFLYAIDHSCAFGAFELLLRGFQIAEAKQI
jgi:hypothetical protein